ncbi:metallophosphoesterase family protein [Pontibacter locisalis]|uniref:Metallophosphoesterase family protein n=1 Tax=Pontibacter locisalis TaxID=1719035 RepID=A0ABW5IJI5_9BACT
MLTKLKSYSRAIIVSVIFSSLAFINQACEEFEYSPYEVRLREDEKDINKRNVEKINQLNISPADTLKFILTADTQGFYEENELLVQHVNQHNGDADFLLLGGDITDFGLTMEFRLVNDDFKKLKMPYVAVIGNHDAINNGQEVFRAMYGDYDISFAVGGSKFILLNTNYLEFDKKVPDLDWLEKELAASTGYQNVFVLSHIPPTNNEFGPQKAERYSNLVSNYNVAFSLHGHNHSFRFHHPFDGRIPYLETGATEKREYIVFTVIGDKVSYERIKF